MTLYSRNSIKEYNGLQGFQIIVGGCGLGGIVAECALRIGFSNFLLVDGGPVTPSDAVLFNYTASEVGMPRVQALQKHLLEVMPDALISIYDSYPGPDTMEDLIQGGSVVVNTFDVSSSMSFLFDRICVEHGLTVLRPFNLGWNGCVFEIFNEASLLEHRIPHSPVNMEWGIVDLVIDMLRPQRVLDIDCLEMIRNQYRSDGGQHTPPQLSAGAYRAASICCELIYEQFTGEQPRNFTGLYHSFPRKFFHPVNYY